MSKRNKGQFHGQKTTRGQQKDPQEQSSGNENCKVAFLLGEVDK